MLRTQGRTQPDSILQTFAIKTPPVDVFGIARRLGVTVRHVEQPGWAGAVQSRGSNAVIWVKVADSVVRRRFTLAHELGHLLLHDTQGIAFRDNNRFSGGPEERDANSFAGQLLVPLWMLEPLVLGLGPDITGLARIFRVSESVMRIRLATLDAT